MLQAHPIINRLRWITAIAVGGLVFGALAIFSIGLLILPVALVLLGFGIRHVVRRGSGAAARAAIAGAVALTVLVLATRAGLALYTNWQLGERERRRAEELSILYDVGLATAGELSLEELASLIAREATALTGTDGAMVALAERGQGFVVRAVHNAPALGLRSSVGEDLRGIALECLRTRDIVAASEYRDHRYRPRLQKDVEDPRRSRDWVR